MKNTVMDAIFWIYTPVIPPNIMDYVILNSDVIRGHWRSLGEVTGGQNRSKRAKNLEIHPGMPFFTYIPLQYP